VAKGDPEEAAVLAALRKEIAALPEGAVILAEDEAHVNLLPWLRSTGIVIAAALRRLAGETVKRSALAGLAKHGYCAAHIRYFWGMRLHLSTTPRRHPRHLVLTDPKIGDREGIEGRIWTAFPVHG
jgi:hypothetical protein